MNKASQESKTRVYQFDYLIYNFVLILLPSSLCTLACSVVKFPLSLTSTLSVGILESKSRGAAGTAFPPRPWEREIGLRW